MYCPNCGQNVPDGTSVCPFCGQSTAPQRPIGSTISMSSASDKLSSVMDFIKMIPARTVAKIALLAAIVCFAFPFVTISCDASGYLNSFNDTDEDYSMELNYKGYHFIFPSTIDEDDASFGSGFSSSSSDDDEDYDDYYENDSSKSKNNSSSKDVRDEDPNGWLIAVVICCAAGCIILFIKLSDWLPAVSAALSLAGIICLSRFKATFADRYLENDSGGYSINYENFVDIDYRFGYSLCMLFMIIALIACTITFLSDKFQYDKRF